MHSKFMKLGFLVLVGVLISFGAAAHAANINTAGAVCQNFNAGQAQDVDYLFTGIRNLNPAPRQVICAIPRSPLTLNTAPRFFIDGHNNANTQTTCTVVTYTFFGTINNVYTFTRFGGAAGANWDVPVNFTNIGFYDYASVVCTIPGSGAGIIYGVTSVQ